MLTLYHNGLAVCAAKVRMVLAEKGLEWESVYIDILRGDQFDPKYMKLNPKALVPTLVHNGHVIVEFTVIAEYLDEVYPDPPLKPRTAEGRAEMRLWTKAVDEHLHPACGEITFATCHRHVLYRMPPEKLAELLDSTPPISVTADWQERKKVIVYQGLNAPGIDATFRLYDRYMQKMEDALQKRRWLVDEQFSLADVCLTPYVNRLDMMGMSEMLTRGRPALANWFDRIKARPSFKTYVLNMCPPDITKDLMTFGSQSWPEIKRMLAA